MASGDLKQRWMRLRNFQSKDFWAMIFARPLTILFLLPVADAAWVTPNRITVLAVLVKAAGISLIALDHSWAAGVWAAVLMNLGLVLDNMDGTLARYRQQGSFFGYILDKVSDAATLILMFWAIGYRAYCQTNDMLDLVLPAVGIGGAYVAAYSKWVADRTLSDIKIKKLVDDPVQLQSWARDRVRHDKTSLPPRRSAVDWLKWLSWAIFSILLINEVDFFLWAAVALISGQYWIFTRVLATILSLGIIVAPIIFVVQVYRAEKQVQV
jgi:hypothetical protein